ncbi:MAG: S1C family serine protease [Nitrospinota bacterium]
MKRRCSQRVRGLCSGVFLAVLLFLLLGSVSSPAETRISDPFEAIVRAAETILPSVVTLEVSVPQEHPAATILGTERVGTGVIVSPSGHILTASYIVMGARKIRVTLTDGRTLPGQVHKIDYSSGLGVVKVKASGLPAAPLGESGGLRVGQMAIAVGSRGESERVVHHGIVSAVRPFTAPWEFLLENAVYTTAMTSGFFGGTPLLDARGRVIGIISLNMTQDRGMGLAIPISLFTAVREDLLDLRPDARRIRPWLGAVTVFVEDELLVQRVTLNGPAWKAGIRSRDVIQEVDGKQVENQVEFYRAVWRHQIGEPIQLTLKRGQETLPVQVTGGNREEFYR